MSNFKLIVLTRPVPGREKDFETWYNEQHLGDVLRIPGIVAAERYEICGAPLSDLAWRYCAIYEVDHAEPEKILDSLRAVAGTPDMPLTDSLDTTMTAALYRSFIRMDAQR